MINRKEFVKFLTLVLKKKSEQDSSIDLDRAFSEIEVMVKNEGMLETFYSLLEKKVKGNKNEVNSYLAFVMGITSKAPEGIFQPKLNFELARVSHPDIDVDFDFLYRDDIYNYLIEKYGREYTSNIGTYQRLKAKKALRTAIKAIDPFNDKDKSLELENNVAALVPGFPGTTLKDALKQVEELQEIKTKYREIFEVAEVIEGLTSHPSTHAAGLVISDVPISQVAPLHPLPDGTYSTQFEMAELEDLGLIKFDILALKTLTVFSEVTKDLKNELDINIDINKLPTDDPKALKLIAEGNTDSVFQLENYGMKELLRAMNVSTFHDVAASNALHRPGAMKSDADDMYCECKSGTRKIEYDHPSLEPILKDTYGQMVYQEQCQLISMVLAGFTRKEADKLRKAIGKKQGDMFIKIKKDFIEKSMKYSGLSINKAEKIWRDMENQGSYAFNKSHAYAYAVLAMQCAYLKVHYPLYYMKAVLNSETLDSKVENIEKYLKECHRMKIKILPCNINKSKAYFSIENKAIRTGLASLKNVALKASLEIEKLAPFNDLEDFVEKTKEISLINQKVVGALIENGAFAEFNLHGEKGLEQYKTLSKHVDYRKKNNIQKSNMFDLSKISFG